MNVSEMVVLADEFHIDQASSDWKDSLLPVMRWPNSLVEGGELLERLFEEGRQGFVLAGGDDLAGRVVTAYWRRSTLGAHSLNLWPLESEQTYVARQLDEVATPRRAVRLLNRGVSTWHRQKVGTLKVSSSTEPAAWYGFTFGAGWIYRASEARKRAQGGAGNFVAAFGRLATDSLRDDDDAVALRVAVDHEPADGQGGSMVATTLKRTYFGLQADGHRAMLWDRLATTSLVRRAVTAGVLQRSKRQARPFESIHLDTPQGWLLDGRLHGAEESGVVQVVPGPTVTLVRPQKGLRAMIRGFWATSGNDI